MKDLEFLEIIYNASISIEDEFTIIPSECIETTIIKDNYTTYDSIKAISFNYNINRINVSSIYSYVIKIYKQPRFFLFFKIKSRYITQVLVRSQFSMTAKEIFYDTSKDKSFKLQHKLFEYLNNRYIRILENNDNSSFDKLINDLGKLVDKKYTRDDKLDKLLK